MPIEGGLPRRPRRDVFMGHEFSAEVLEAGPDTVAPPPGTLVTSLPVLLSMRGFEPIVYSNDHAGGYGERMLLSAPMLLEVPNGLDPRHASLTEPMAVGLHAVNKTPSSPARAPWCSAAGRSDSRSSARCSSGASTHRGRRLLARPRALASSWAPRGRRPGDGAGVRRVVRPVDRGTCAWCSRRSASRGSSTTCCATPRQVRASSWSGCAWRPTGSSRSSGSARRSTCSSPRLRPDGVRRDAARDRRGRDRRRAADHRRGRPRRRGGGVRRSRRARRALQDPRPPLTHRIGCQACRSSSGADFCCAFALCC